MTYNPNITTSGHNVNLDANQVWTIPDTTFIPATTITVGGWQSAPVIKRTIRKNKANVKRKKNKNTTAKETYITLVLDKSGSMSDCYAAALSAINEQIGVIKREGHKGGKTFVSIILFDHEIEIIEENTPVNQLRPLTKDDYVLGGMTALRDAVSTAIDIMHKEQDRKKNQGFLMVLISDGQENSSGTTQQDLQSKISELSKDERWTFTYLLDGHSWQQVQQWSITYGTPIGNMNTYTSTAAGTVRGSSVIASSVCNYMDARSEDLTGTKTFYNDGSGEESKV